LLSLPLFAAAAAVRWSLSLSLPLPLPLPLIPGAACQAHHRKWDADFADDTDSSLGCIAKTTKIAHRKEHEDITIESGRREAGRASDFVETRSGCRVGLAPPSESGRESSRSSNGESLT